MVSQGYEEIDHTADLAIKVWGEDFYSLLKHAARGLFDLMGCNPKLDSQIECKFHVARGTSETILVDFLSELLYLCEYKNLAFETFAFVEQEDGLQVNATGYEVDSIERNIKAVTFHDLDIREIEAGLEVIITFDV